MATRFHRYKVGHEELRWHELQLLERVGLRHEQEWLSRPVVAVEHQPLLNRIKQPPIVKLEEPLAVEPTQLQLHPADRKLELLRRKPPHVVNVQRMDTQPLRVERTVELPAERPLQEPRPLQVDMVLLWQWPGKSEPGIATRQRLARPRPVRPAPAQQPQLE